MTTSDKIENIYLILKIQSYALKTMNDPECTKAAEELGGLAEGLASKYLSETVIQNIWKQLQNHIR